MSSCPTEKRCVKAVSLTVIMKGVNQNLTLLLRFCRSKQILYRRQSELCYVTKFLFLQLMHTNYIIIKTFR